MRFIIPSTTCDTCRDGRCPDPPNNTRPGNCVPGAVTQAMALTDTSMRKAPETSSQRPVGNKPPFLQHASMRMRQQLTQQVLPRATSGMARRPAHTGLDARLQAEVRVLHARSALRLGHAASARHRSRQILSRSSAVSTPTEQRALPPWRARPRARSCARGVCFRSPSPREHI